MLISDRQTVPFLPANPEYSATRNQVTVISDVNIDFFVNPDIES